VVASTVPLAWRRRWPALVLVAVSLPEAVLQANQMVGAGFLNVLIAAYSLGAYLGAPPAGGGFGGVLAAWSGSWWSACTARTTSGGARWSASTC
jgi:hypothetical protein